jgi:hypothetical protein
MRIVGCLDNPDMDVEFCQHRDMNFCNEWRCWCPAKPEEEPEEDDEPCETS